MEKVLSSKIVFECPIFKVEECEVELPSGKVEKRWYILRRDAVAVVPITKDGKVVLIKEYRSAYGGLALVVTCWRSKTK